jgi:hypothetical protein
MRHSPNTVLTIQCTPRGLFGCLLSLNNQHITIHRYGAVVLQHLELEQLVLFNPTRISSYINHWYRIVGKQVPLLMSLSGPSLIEQLVPLPITHPTIDQFPISHSPDWHWEFIYLYSIDTMHYFYLTGIRRSILFQYQLLALHNQFPLQTITSHAMALLALYRYKSGSTYRASQLAEHLTRVRSIERLFAHDDLERIATLPSGITISKEETLPLLIACGLLMGESR